MPSSSLTSIGVVITAVLVAGCGAAPRNSTASDTEYEPPPSIYNTMDTTVMAYTDPTAASPLNDHPYRWLAYVLHPIGQAFDYTINRPLYKLASTFDSVFGYTREDSTLDSQRN
jgi:hypothetical protein